MVLVTKHHSEPRHFEFSIVVEFNGGSKAININAGSIHDGALNSGRKAWKYTMHTIMFISSMGLLIWITYNGYKLTQTTRYPMMSSSYGGYIGFAFGVVTVIFGLMYFIIGLTMVGEIASGLLAWLRQEDNEVPRNEEKEQATNGRHLVHTLTIMASIVMVTSALYYGYKLAAEGQEDVIYNRLAYLVGVVSMAFGFINILIWLGIVAQSALYPSGSMHQFVAESDAFLDSTEMNFEV